MSRHSLPIHIAADHPALAGHFPGHPIVPGVVLLDEVLHAIELALHPLDAATLWQIDAVKYHRAVHPEEPLQLEFESLPDAQLRFELRTCGALVASGTLRRR
jgi:3-hydroxyacyl-[acyl-carrier-protein] dehydratase